MFELTRILLILDLDNPHEFFFFFGIIIFHFEIRVDSWFLIAFKDQEFELSDL